MKLRGGRWSWRNITYVVTYCVDNELRHRDLTFWRRWWIEGWGWVFHRCWWWVWPHLQPRTYARECYDFWLHLRLPSQINGFVWGDERDGYCAEAIEANGPWRFCCGSGDTAEEAKKSLRDLLKWCDEEAGMQGSSYSIYWFNREPTNEDKSHTS